MQVGTMALRSTLALFVAVVALLSATAQASVCVGASGLMGRVCKVFGRDRRERRQVDRVRRSRGELGSYGYGGDVAGASHCNSA